MMKMFFKNLQALSLQNEEWISKCIRINLHQSINNGLYSLLISLDEGTGVDDAFLNLKFD